MEFGKGRRKDPLIRMSDLTHSLSMDNPDNIVRRKPHCYFKTIDIEIIRYVKKYTEGLCL